MGTGISIGGGAPLWLVQDLTNLYFIFFSYFNVFIMQRTFGTVLVKLKIGRISSLHSSLYISNHSASYINQALTDNDEGIVSKISHKGATLFVMGATGFSHLIVTN